MIAIAQLMVVLDATVVNIALPSAQEALRFSNEQRQWIITAYALAFGSLLLLGGRIGGLFGRKRAFVIGLIGFAVATALGGLRRDTGCSSPPGPCRACSARCSPRRAVVLTTTFTDPEERGKAFGVFGAVAVGGAAIGLIMGGVLTEYLNWRWCLYVNLAFALPAAFAAMTLLHARSPRRQRIDIPGALTATTGLFAIVYGLANAETQRLGRRTSGCSPAGAVLLAASSHPDAQRVPAAAAARRPRPRPRRCVPRDAAGGRGDVRRLPVPDVLPAAEPRLLADPDGLGVPADDRHDRHRAASGSTKLMPRVGPRP